MTPTPEQLTAWKALAEKATPGPWEARATTFWSGKNNYMSVVSKLYSIAKMTGSEHNLEFARIDADFIAAARVAVPALLAEVERLQWEANKHQADPLMETGIATLQAERDTLRERVAELEAWANAWRDM